MKKSLADMTTAEKAPKKTFGAFTSVEGSQAQIDLNILKTFISIFLCICIYIALLICIGI